MCTLQTMLFDGTRLIPHQQYTELLQSLGGGHAAKQQLDQQRVVAVHPNFRIIATATLPSDCTATSSSHGIGDVLSPEIIPLFHYHHVAGVTSDELCKLLAHAGVYCTV
jgi:hypothetical protein